MDIKTAKKAIAVTGIALLLLNMLFVALGYYSHLVFWVFIAVIGLASLGLIKLLNKQAK